MSYTKTRRRITKLQRLRSVQRDARIIENATRFLESPLIGLFREVIMRFVEKDIHRVLAQERPS